MARKIVDCKDTTTGELVYPKTHGDAVLLSDGRSVATAIEQAEAAQEFFLTDDEADGKYQAAGLSFANVEASEWVESTTYDGFAYQCDVACAGVTADDFAEVVFDLEESTSCNYAPLCETLQDAVRIYSTSNEMITIPTIIITK